MKEVLELVCLDEIATDDGGNILLNKLLLF